MATLRSTLCQVEDSLLASMFSGRWEDSMSRDKEGRIFLNFDPKYYSLILGHLRTKEISTPDNPPRLPNVPFKKDKNFHLLVEYLGLTKEMLPELTECFKEHSQGMQLEENGTAAVFRSEQRTVQLRRGQIQQQPSVYSRPQHEFVFGKNVYEEGTIQFRLEIDVNSGESEQIFVGVIPSNFPYSYVHEITGHSQGEYLYGSVFTASQGRILCRDKAHRWFYKTPTTLQIELILDCDTEMLYFNFHDGKQLNLRLPAGCNKWKLFFKLHSFSNRDSSEQLVHVRVAILEYVRESGF